MLAKDAHIQPQRANSLLKSHVSYEQMKDFLYPPTIQINIYGNKSTIKHETKRVQAFESSRLKSSHESLSDLSPLESKSQWLRFISLTDTHTYTGIIAYTPVVYLLTHTQWLGSPSAVSSLLLSVSVYLLTTESTNIWIIFMGLCQSDRFICLTVYPCVKPCRYRNRFLSVTIPKKTSLNSTVINWAMTFYC